MLSTSPAARIKADKPILPAQSDSAHRAAAVNVAAAPVSLDYAIVSTREDLDALAAEWDALFARAGRGTQLFQTFGWCWHWCNHYLDDHHSLAVATARHKGRLALVWPMVVKRVAGAVQLSAMGDPVSQYSDALVEPSPYAGQQLKQAWHALVALVRPDLVWLPNVRSDAAIAPIVSSLGGLVALRRQAPYIDLGGNARLDSPMSHQSASCRKKQRAAARRLAKVGSVAFIEHNDSAASSKIATGAIDMKRQQLSERGLLSPTFADPRLRRFFADVAGSSRHRTGTRALALSCNGERVAIDILVAAKDHIATHVIAYDARFSKEEVGWQLLSHAIGKVRAEGFRTFDLMAPADPYKLRWADGIVDVIDWVVPVTKKGAVVARIRALIVRPLLKRLARALPRRLCSSVAGLYYRRAVS